jgi:hypothetical protein
MAAELIRAFPSEAVSILVTVEIPPRLPGLQRRVGTAEVARAWPVGRYQCLYKDSLISRDLAVTAEGKTFEAGGQSRGTVALDDRMQWQDPTPQAPWGPWKAEVYLALEREQAARAGLDPQQPESSPQLTGTITGRSSRKAFDLRNKRSALISQHQKYLDLYGTRAQSRMHGPPTSGAKKAWGRLDSAQRKITAINRKIEALGVDIPPVDLLP